MRGNRLLPSIAIALLAALGSGLVGPYVAHAADKPKAKPKPGAAAARVTFGVQPATKGAADARPNYRYSVTPAGTLRDQVAVRNLSTKSVTFRVYATDALNIDNGRFGLLPRAQRPRDVGAWVTVGGRASDGTVTVKARSVKVLPLSLKVPANAQPGDHTGGVIVAVTTRSRNSKGIAANVELDQRIGARMFVRVSGPLRPSLTVQLLDAHYENLLNPIGRGDTDVTYRVTNTGNINLGGRMRLSVRGLVGPEQLSVQVPDAGLLLPGGFIDVKAVVPNTWPLVRETATVTIDPLVQRGDPAAGLPKYSGTTDFWAVPWAFLALLIVLGAGLWFTWRSRRKRRARATGAPASGPGTTETRAFDTDGIENEGIATGVSKRSVGRLGATSSLALAAVIATSGTAMAADVPYTDVNATGGITLCDAQGRVRTSGRVDVPLATTVVGATPAAAPYDGDGRTAGLFAYQPRQGVEPGEWSGQGMSGLSRYSNPRHPMAEILPRAYKVSDFVQSYPAQWDGLLQLRIYLRAPDQTTKDDTYDATSLKVTGNTWQQVGTSAGGVCGSGRAQSVARLLGLPTTEPSAPKTGPQAGPQTGPQSGLPSGLPSGSASSPLTRSAGASPLTRPTAGARASTSSVIPSSPVPSSSLTESNAANAAAARASTEDSGGLLSEVLPIAMLIAAVLLLWLWGRRWQASTAQTTPPR